MTQAQEIASDPNGTACAETESAPRPTFDVLPLSPELRETLTEIGYLHPTPVQLAVWEPATRGRDAVVQARTGTGKTAAFALPIVDQIVRRSLCAAQVLVLCPTRELALQVCAETERLGKRRKVSVVAVYGGAPMPRQVDAIAGGAQVVVGTPGRVLDHLRRKTLDPTTIRMLVLDEADEMLSMGFERELSAIVERLPAERQTLLFSATVPPDIERIARTRLRTPEFVTLSGDHIGALEVLHLVYMVSGDKPKALVRVIEVENPESAIVFCNTRDETENVTAALTRQGFDADWLNGDLPQSEREKVMAATREGRLRFLVATDVAARGIDISHLTHVMNYDFPLDAESYVHRTGRTGRAGRTGTAISLITPKDIGALYLLRLTYKIRPIERQIPTEGELKTRAEADLCAMLAEAFGGRGTHPDDIALARRLLSHDRREEIIAGLLRDHLGARPTAQEEAAAARRMSRPVRSSHKSRQSDERAASAAGPPRAAGSPADAPSSETRGTHAASNEDPRGARRGRMERSREGHGERHRANNGPRQAMPRKLEAAEHALPSAPEVAPRPRPDRQRPSAAGGRHADLTDWQPPEEDGDDQPLLRSLRDRPQIQTATAAAPASRNAQRASDGGDQAEAGSPRTAPAVAAPDDDFAEIWVSVGRRDGVRAGDLARALTEFDGAIARDDVRRIRVRDSHSFVAVRKAELERAVALLGASTIAGKTPTAEPARERPAKEDSSADFSP